MLFFNLLPKTLYCDIRLIPKEKECKEKCFLFLPSPYIIDQKVPREPSQEIVYKWEIGKAKRMDGKIVTVPDGEYKIEVCESGTNICDQSDNYFKILPAKKTILVQLNNLQIKEIQQNPEEGILATFIVTKPFTGFKCLYVPDRKSGKFRSCPFTLKTKILKALIIGLKVNISEKTSLDEVDLDVLVPLAIQNFQAGNKINVYGDFDKNTNEIDALSVFKITRPLKQVPKPY